MQQHIHKVAFAENTSRPHSGRDKMSRAVAVVAAIALAACTSGSNSPSDAERVAIADSIKSASTDWRRAAERADVPAILSHYLNAPEAAVVVGDNLEQTTTAFEYVAGSLPTALGRHRSQSITLADQKIGILGRDAAAETAVGEWVSTDTTGRVTRNHFAYTRVWARRDSGWKIFHSNLTVLPLPTAGPSRR